MVEQQSNILHKKSLFWGLIPIQNKPVSVGHKDGFEDTWHDEEGEGRYRYFKISIDSLDKLSIHDWKNVYLGRTDIELTGEQINKQYVSVPQSCVVGIVHGLVGYENRYIYKAPNSK